MACWAQEGVKIPNIFRPKYFLRCGHMVLGVLRTCKEVMKNEILRSINLLKRWFFQTKKKFRKFRPKNVILSCGFNKRFWGQKGTEYMTSISIEQGLGHIVT